ncbi:hypothetical protein UNDKW_5647 [Undibacterium sp. KW1]|nr:hypothetical protein UNDKW_5647 [Undibacterium sp. KW1]
MLALSCTTCESDETRMEKSECKSIVRGDTDDYALCRELRILYYIHVNWKYDLTMTFTFHITDI